MPSGTTDATGSQFFAMRPATYEYRDLLTFYTVAERLASWLTKNGAIGEAGQRYASSCGTASASQARCWRSPAGKFSCRGMRSRARWRSRASGSERDAAPSAFMAAAGASQLSAQPLSRRSSRTRSRRLTTALVVRRMDISTHRCSHNKLVRLAKIKSSRRDRREQGAQGIPRRPCGTAGRWARLARPQGLRIVTGRATGADEGANEPQIRAPHDWRKAF